jgi:hypothetical protein
MYRQRQKYAEGKLSDEQIQQLSNIGCSFGSHVRFATDNKSAEEIDSPDEKSGIVTDIQGMQGRRITRSKHLQYSAKRA